ncbi:hypothetical protein [Streptomyces sp. 6N223]|uniref:hypothetical protein n=1 Tax=Streptomyces sp. 6N223 TaxID=3457412 RepID=UPI003FD0F7BB
MSVVEHTDPEPSLTGDPAISTYAYAENTPTVLTDPSGRCPWCVSVGLGAAIGGLVEAESTPSPPTTSAGAVSVKRQDVARRSAVRPER